MNFFNIKPLIVGVTTSFALFLNAQETVYTNSFDDLETGVYTINQAKEAFDVNFFKGAEEGRVAVVEFENKGKVLRAFYPQGKLKTEDSGFHTKLFWDNPTNEKQEELYFSYNIYIPEDFEFRAGAKIPGLAYQTRDRNMSVRLMWRYDGKLEYYNHFNTKPSWEGWSASVDWSLTGPYSKLVNGQVQADQAKLKKGQWNHIELYNKLNTPGQSDGIMRAWLNGVLALDITDNEDYRQADEGDIGLNCIYLSTFFGGSDENYEPTKDQYAYFDDFIISKTRIGYNQNTNTDNEETTDSDATSEIANENDSDTDSIENENPVVNLTFPVNDAIFTVGETITFTAAASDNDGLRNVNFKINDRFYNYDAVAPYATTFTPTAAGTYKIAARAIDNERNSSEDFVTITVVDQENEDSAINDDENNTTDNSGNNTTNSCSFGTPASSALTSFNRASFDNIYVLGSGGPDVSQIRRFRINWDASRSELYQFAVNTKNGIPSNYLDLRANMSYSFNNTNPELTLNNTGLAGWDGSYWVNNDGDNFVMVSKNGGFTIYFTNGAAPNCGSSAKSLLSDTSELSVKIYPNPATDVLNVSGISVNTTANVIDIQGRIVKSILLNAEETIVDISELQRGMYFLNVDNNSKTISFIKK